MNLQSIFDNLKKKFQQGIQAFQQNQFNPLADTNQAQPGRQNAYTDMGNRIAAATRQYMPKPVPIPQAPIANIFKTATNVTKTIQNAQPKSLQDIFNSVRPVQDINTIGRAMRLPQTQNIVKTVQQNPVIKGIASMPIIDPVLGMVKDTIAPPAMRMIPLKQIPGVTQLQQYSPTIGQYTKGQIIDPLQVVTNEKANPISRVLNAGQVAANITSPARTTLFNITSGAIAGGLKALRTKTDPSNVIATSISDPSKSGIGSTGLGLEGFPALAVDMLSGNPKSIVATAKKGKTIIQGLKGYSPRAFDIHPADQEIMGDFVNAVGDLGGKSAKLDPRLLKDAQNIAEHYIGEKARGISNVKLAKTFDALLASAAKQRGEDVMSMPFPKMGLVSTNDALHNLSRGAKVSRVANYAETKNLEVELRNALSGAQNPNDEGIIIGQFTNSLLKENDPKKLKAARAALNKEINGVVGNQGSYKKNYAIRQILKDDPYVGEKIRALENGIATIDEATTGSIQRNVQKQRIPTSNTPITTNLPDKNAVVAQNEKTINSIDEFFKKLPENPKASQQFAARNPGIILKREASAKKQKIQELFTSPDLPEGYTAADAQKLSVPLARKIREQNIPKEQLTKKRVQELQKQINDEYIQQQKSPDVLAEELLANYNKVRAQDRRAQSPAELFDPTLIQKRVQNSKPLPEITATQPSKIEQKAIKAFEQDVLKQKKPSQLEALFNPVKKLTPDEQNAFYELDRARKVAQVEGNTVAANLFKTKLNPNLEWKLVQYSQKPSPAYAKRLGLTEEEITDNAQWLTQNQQFNDKLFKDIQDAGVGKHFDEDMQQMVDMQYRTHHIYQKWKNTQEEINTVARGLAKAPGNAYKRKIPSFEEGLQGGLTPEYTTFGQLNGAMQHAYLKAKANKTFIEKMVANGSLAPESEAPGNWQMITAKYFPKAEVDGLDGQKIKQTYYAPPDVATVINNYFGGQPQSGTDKALGFLAHASRVAQDVTLSGGIGPINFFSVGQLAKEGTAMRFATPTKALLRSFLRSPSKKFEVENAQSIKEMAGQGISISGVGRYQKLYKNVITDKNILQKIITGDAKGIGNSAKGMWDTLFNEPTFNRFMTQLQVGFYNDTKKAFLAKGMNADEAVQQAASATKKFYGISESLGRAKSLDDSLTTIMMAPKYRESMVNIFSQMGKSLLPQNITKPDNRSLQKLALGMALTYGMYNVAQYNKTGKYMWDNPPGKEFELVIPVGDPKDKKYISVPWMPGFTAVPRRIASSAIAAAKGDIKESVGQLGGLLSIPMSKATDLVRNKDYFGNEIMSDNNQVGDAAMYVAKSVMPGWLRAGTDIVTGKSTLPFGIAQGLEMPIRKGTFPNEYYKAKDEEMAKLPKELRTQGEYLLMSDKAQGADADTEARMMLGNDELLNFKRNVTLRTNPNDPLWSRSPEDIKAFLAYRLLADDGGSDTQKRAQIALAYPWIPQVQYQNSLQMYNSKQDKSTPTAGYDPNSITGKLGEWFNPPQPTNTSNMMQEPIPAPKQQLTEEQVKIASAYTAAPKGSVARKQLLAANPWLNQYWDAQNAYYKENPIVPKGPLADFLASIGIDPSNAQSNSFFGYGAKKKKAKASALAKLFAKKSHELSKLSEKNITKEKQANTRKLAAMFAPQKNTSSLIDEILARTQRQVKAT